MTNLKRKYTTVKRDREKKQAVVFVATKFDVTEQYVYGVLRGTFNSGIADEIKQLFNQKYSELKKVLAV